ncbi:hypothetical protein [Pontibacter litorisediminis]|uniref:hypothetical protein n=1 Tax=Pontibacter litorisediminis TaxID=1846260 RepID=UPI0023EB6B60|nr:hypothetical protein [Pontibacter litorisediminis]
MKTKLLAPLLGLLLLTGCGEDDEPNVSPNPEPQSICYLQEQTVVVGDKTSTISYSYNELNQVIRTEHYEQGELQEIRTYTYTAEGKLNRELLLTPEEEEVSFTVYSYNPGGRLSKYEVKQQVPGLEAVHQLASYKVAYDQLGRLTTATDYLYQNNREVASGSVSQTYPQSGGMLATVKGQGGQTLYTATIQQDTSKYAPLSATPVYLHRRPGAGYPNLNVITSFKATTRTGTGTGTEVKEVENVAFTAEYEYNEQGYPVAGTITYAGEGSRPAKVSYSYTCPD